MPWPQICATQYHAQLGLSDKDRAIKELVVCNSWDLEPWDLLQGLALGCYQLSPEVLLVYPIKSKLFKVVVRLVSFCSFSIFRVDLFMM